MSLKDRVVEDMKAAMRARQSARLSTIRLLLAAMKQREVDERITLSDADVLSIIDKMMKQRRDSVAQFGAGGRPDLVAIEQAEIAVLAEYMPLPLSPTEIAQMIQAAIAETGAAGIAGMGKVMAVLRPKLAGRADLGDVSAQVKARLSA
ncbi:MAG: GatB/YqeY domain-containing protein [Betaproteobacteria bacterium]